MYSKLVAALVGPSAQVKGKTFVRLANLQKIEKEKKGHEIREYRVRTGCLTGLPLLFCSVPIPAHLTGGPTAHYHPRHWVRWVRSTVDAFAVFDISRSAQWTFPYIYVGKKKKNAYYYIFLVSYHFGILFPVKKVSHLRI